MSLPASDLCEVHTDCPAYTLCSGYLLSRALLQHATCTLQQARPLQETLLIQRLQYLNVSLLPKLLSE